MERYLRWVTAVAPRTVGYVTGSALAVPQGFVLCATAEEAELLEGRLGQCRLGEGAFLRRHLFPYAAALPAGPRHAAFLALLRRLPELDPEVLDMLPKVGLLPLRLAAECECVPLLPLQESPKPKSREYPQPKLVDSECCCNLTLASGHQWFVSYTGCAL